MNQNPSPTAAFRILPDPNPWDHKDTLPRPAVFSAVLLALLATAAGVYLPLVCSGYLTAHPAVADAAVPVMAVACLFYLLFAARSVSTLLCAVLTFSVAGTLGGTAAGVAAVALFFSVAIGAFLLTTVRRPWLLAIVPTAAFLLTFLLCREPTPAVLALLPWPAAGLLAYSTMGNQGRLTAICTTSVMLGLCVCLAAALLYYRSHGAIRWEELLQKLDEARQNVIRTLENSETAGQLSSRLAELGYNVNQTIEALVNLIYHLLPALAISAVNFMAYSAQLLLTCTYRGLKLPGLVTRSAQLFVMSVPSAVLYLLCTLVSFFTSDLTMFGAVTENIRLILLPGLCVVGFWKLLADLRRRPSPFLIILIVVGIFVAPAILILCLSISGAVATLMRRILAQLFLRGGFPGDSGNSGSSDDGSSSGNGDDAGDHNS